jgi:hypothetical protein
VFTDAAAKHDDQRWLYIGIGRSCRSACVVIKKFRDDNEHDGQAVP